jgi:hypothetical protein
MSEEAAAPVNESTPPSQESKTDIHDLVLQRFQAIGPVNPPVAPNQDPFKSPPKQKFEDEQGERPKVQESNDFYKKTNETKEVSDQEKPEEPGDADLKESDKAQQKDKVSQKQIDEARKALERDGWKKSNLVGLSDDVLIDMGNRSKSRQDGQSQKYDQLLEKNRELQGLVDRIPQETYSQGDNDARPGAHVQSAPESSAFKRLSEEYDESLASNVNGLIEERVSSALASAVPGFDQVKTELESLKSAYVNDRLDHLLDRQSDSHPKLKDPYARDAVKEKASELAGIQSYYDDSGRADMSRLVSDAVMLVVGNELIGKQKSIAQQRYQEQLGGQVEPGPGHEEGVEHAVSTEDYHNKAAQLLVRGYSPAQIESMLKKPQS